MVTQVHVGAGGNKHRVGMEVDKYQRPKENYQEVSEPFLLPPAIEGKAKQQDATLDSGESERRQGHRDPGQRKANERHSKENQRNGAHGKMEEGQARGLLWR